VTGRQEMTAKERKKDVLHAKYRYLLLITYACVIVGWCATGFATCMRIIEALHGNARPHRLLHENSGSLHDY